MKVLSSIDIDKLKVNDFGCCDINLFEQTDDNKDCKYLKLYLSNKNKIIEYKGNSNNAKLLFYYCYLNSRIFKRNPNDELVISGGRAEACYASYEGITNDTKITSPTITKYNKILDELNLIHFGNGGLFYYKTDKYKKVHESCNVYVMHDDNEDIWKNNLKEGIKLYKLNYADVRIFTGKKTYKNNDRSINGRYGSLVKKQKHNIISDDELIELQKIKEFQNVNEVKLKRSQLLNDPKNDNELISSIFYNNDNEKLGDFYLQLETQLELYNFNTDKFLVDWKYYKWIIINYESDKHIYYANCINKHSTKPLMRWLHRIDTLF
jgi:hypothetical protein